MAKQSLDLAEVHKLQSEELTKQLRGLKEELFNLRFQHHTGQLENTARITHVKRNIARLMTVLRQRENAG